MADQIISAKHVLTDSGWRRDVHVTIDAAGRIAAIGAGGKRHGLSVGALLPAPGNAHSHSFQHAMAGLTETRGAGVDDFWSWRQLMYHFLQRLSPDQIEAIAAMVQMQMLEAGFAAVGEFHYLHHQPDGSPYDALTELTSRMFAAAAETGIGYTHLPVLYMRGGMDGRPLEGGQRRFGCDLGLFERLFDETRTMMKALPADCRLGVAPHSLRAVDAQSLAFAVNLQDVGPIHIHVAEQTGEVEEVRRALGAAPVRWLLDNADVDERWCLVHATHMTTDEIAAVAASKSVVSACPITESNLGDGIFEAQALLAAGGRIAVGSDSNITISLSEELRTLEYSQRLRDRRRVVLADEQRSCGRYILEETAKGGAQALGRDAGRIEEGAIADLVAIDSDSPLLAGLVGDRLIDAWIFAGSPGNTIVSDVWAAGRHVVKGGRHIKRDAVSARFNKAIATLRAGL